MLLVIIVAETVTSLYKFAHATGDNCRGSCVSSLNKLLMLLVIMIAEAVLRVNTRCSGYW